jgi:hypothetical protein
VVHDPQWLLSCVVHEPLQQSWRAPHWKPQLPQLFGSESVSMHATLVVPHGLAAAQQVWPAAHALPPQVQPRVGSQVSGAGHTQPDTHIPPEQLSVGWQALLQSLQWSWLDDKSKQPAPGQHFSLVRQARPPLQLHTDETQFSLGWQAWLQPPQLFGSCVVSTQFEPQQV